MTRSPQTVIKTHPKSASLRRFCTIILIATFAVVIYFIFKKPIIESLGDPSDQYTIKNIPKIYSSSEGIDPEERDVFLGFRTSFLPPEEIVLARRSLSPETSDSEGNVSSDLLIRGDKEDALPPRVKRMSQSFPSRDYDQLKSHGHPRDGSRDVHDEYIQTESEAREEYETEDSDYEDDESLESNIQTLQKLQDGFIELPKISTNNSILNSNAVIHFIEKKMLYSIVHPELHVDRGPLDDVVEQIRGQPELEEGEILSSATIYKPSSSYTGIHSFWKGQGDRFTIRNTQARIMKQYMDADADPCHDFYQYACGNWASLNPIPADKAGYDTFEMLRENLDSVLKDLLKFKVHEKVDCVYPGAHLDLNHDFMVNVRPCACNKNKTNKIQQVDSESTESDPDTEANKQRCPVRALNKNELLHRIRKYIDRKMDTLSEMRGKFRKHVSETKYSEKRIKRYIPKHKKNAKGEVIRRKLVIKTKQIRYGRRLMMIKTRIKKGGRIIENVTNSTTEIATTPIVDPPSTPSSSTVSKKHQRKLNKSDPANGDAALKARFLFKSCMNYEILQKRGHQPLLDLLQLLGGWPILNSKWNATKFDWLELVARLRLFNNDILISEWVGPDIKNSDEFVIQFDQTSLGLPTRDYFLQASNKVYLDAYKTYLRTIAMLLGGNEHHVDVSANELIDFEIKLAKITSAPEDRRNVSELYRRMPLRKLEKLVPQVQWRKYLCIVMNRTVQPTETVVLFALCYVRHLVQLIDKTEPSVLANYLLWRFVRHRVNNLDDRFQLAKQQFYYILFGREQAPPRWKNCVSQVNSNMGMALGSMFVRKYFDEMSKNDTLTMTREIQQSFRELLHMTNWIDDKTKKLAAHKVDAMMLRIGYPDFILTKKELNDRYREVMIHPDKYFENILNILQHLTKMEQARIGQPVNKTLWNTAPAVVNAYYSRNKNQIMFPAGILQPPFYHQHFPRSLNYGGIGVVIGHEITHGFDDKGRLFDCDGNLHRWWSDSAIESFHRRAQCLIDQYGRYVVPEVNMKLDGVNTQGENIADNGGVKQAFRAYVKWVEKHGTAGETLPGLPHTHTQLFFLNFAQVWCGAMRPEAMRNKLKTAVHSPGRFRVIGTLSNSHDFAREFRCKVGTPMNPTYKCSVW